MLYLATLLLVGGYPMMTVAAADTPAPSTTATATALAPAPVKPKTTYTYDKATGHWNTNAWVYNPATNQYEPVSIPVAPVPSSPQVITPTSPAPAVDGVTTPSTTAPSSGSEKSASMTATDSATKTATSATTTATAGATTGDAAVTKNGTAGNATSGNASSTASLLNTVNSQLSTGDNKQAATFVANITGDVTGDIVLQPMLLKAMLEAGASGSATNTASTSTSNQLTNDLNLSALSGSAAVTNNTKAGNATTGSANTVVDVVNIINSMVAANQSFTGTVNIYGNLNGDILIAPDFIPQLLASNGLSPNSNAPQIVNATDTQSIINNVSLAAASGQAAVQGNTSAGSATSGLSKTNTVIFNLSGHEIVASNSLLVFVNVLGTWVGVIVDAPSGTTAAAIGNGVMTNTVNTPALVISAETDNQITNNINLSSQSGDALIAGNTIAGSATSGNATASANIANISNSQIGVSGWFGVLYINVFGFWHGSFGVNTSAGDPLPARSPVVTAALTQPVAFIPHAILGVSQRIAAQPATIITRDGDGTYQQTTTQTQPALLASATKSMSQQPGEVLTLTRETPRGADYRLPIALGSIALIGGSIIGLRRLLRG